MVRMPDSRNQACITAYRGLNPSPPILHGKHLPFIPGSKPFISSGRTRNSSHHLGHAGASEAALFEREAPETTWQAPGRVARYAH